LVARSATLPGTKGREAGVIASDPISYGRPQAATT
jgi:hypothetical protein